MALTRIERLLKMINDITKKKSSKERAEKFRREALKMFIQDAPEDLTEQDINILKEELKKCESNCK